MLLKSANATLLVALFMTLPASGQETSRYTMERTENGYVRLDTVTGEVSLCRERDEQMVCRMATDERQAFEAELSALSDRVAALEEAIDDGARRGANLPTDEEIDRTMGIMETFMRRFFSIIEDLNRDFNTDSSEENLPERT